MCISGWSYVGGIHGISSLTFVLLLFAISLRFIQLLLGIKFKCEHDTV